MKKNRLLAIFAAFAVAATMAIGVTACGDNDNGNDNTGDNTQTENPDDGNPENPEDEDTVVTKEEWIKVWQDSTSADSYALDYDGWTFMVSSDEVGNKYYVKMLYDNVNKTTYMQYTDSNEASELYAEVVGSNLLQYINSNGEWLSSTWSASNWENGNQLLSYASTVYTVAETTVSGTLAELYDYVKYDASSKTYSVNAAIKDNIVTLKVQLSDGYLYKLFISVEVDGETYEDKITFTGYNSTVVTVPQEVKDAVGGTDTPENPDDEDTGVTKEEWIKAFENFVNATSFTMIATEKGDINLGEIRDVYECTVETRLDKVNNTCYFMYEEDGEMEERYTQIVGTEITEYTRNYEGGAWSAWECDTGDTGGEDYWFDMNPVAMFLVVTFNVPETTASGKIPELYDYAEFDSSTNTYTLKVAIDNIIITLEFQFKDGNLYKFIRSEKYGNEGYRIEITITDVNSTVVTIPQELKDAAGGNGNGDDPYDKTSYVGTYKVYSLIFGTTEYFVGDMAPAIGSGEQILLTEDYMVIVLNEDGTAIVSQTVGDFTQDIECTWEAFDVFIMIYMNGDLQGFLAEDNTIFTNIYFDATSVDPLVWTITLIKQ